MKSCWRQFKSVHIAVFLLCDFFVANLRRKKYNKKYYK
jgi:hypothetical protein